MVNKSKRAIVTGGSRGIGLAIVKEVAARNCSGILFSDIVFVDNSCDECVEEIQKEVDNLGTKIYGFKADASSFADAQATIDEAIKNMGGVDILVNNAGITRDNLLLRMSEKEFDDVININLKSVFNYTKAVLRPMIQQKYGRIINIASVVGLIGNAGQANYAASKAGVIGFTKSTAREVASRGITVNAVAPGFIETHMTAKLNDKQREALRNIISRECARGPRHEVYKLRFSSSDEAAY